MDNDIKYKPFWVDVKYVTTVQQESDITIYVDIPYDSSNPITIREAAQKAAEEKASTWAFSEELQKFSNFKIGEVKLGDFYHCDSEGEPNTDYKFNVDEGGSWTRV